LAKVKRIFAVNAGEGGKFKVKVYAMTFVARVFLGFRPEWIDKRRSARRSEPQEIMPLEGTHPDSGSSLHEQLMAAFRSSGLEWFQMEEDKEGSAREEGVLRDAMNLASELARLGWEEKQRLLKNVRLGVMA
jgi:hypothetical protein